MIGYIAQRAGPWHLDAAFLDGLRELGYAEGRHFRMEYRWGPNVADLPALAVELVRLRVDVIVSSGYPSNKAAKDATVAVPIPIVMATSGDAVQEGLVATLSRPGGNITGLSVLNRELTGKRLQVIREAVPGLRRIGALFNGSNPAMPPQFSEVQAAAQMLGLQAVPLDVSFPAGIEPAFASSSKSGIGAVMILSDSSTIAHRNELCAAALRHRMPTIFSNRDYIRAGGMMSYGPNLAENFKQAAAYVDRILKGANPATMPVQQPTRFELIVNRGTAKGLGIALPQSLLVRADDFVD
ncbi:ABC transporter substrate-binding protein [Leptothrix discophora]|uniref:ABC transporter substrate-binding protein n=1 Tax=Leptothrix discophora TaxID=89 RepID=A0ABT9G860_LEPDI|nr:ABC transporter substrate-binding protein [Leptothrix discophora]MDP4302663.1 ABC transporter substrate-binding protein [Leptothrix discophora]